MRVAVLAQFAEALCSSQWQAPGQVTQVRDGCLTKGTNAVEATSPRLLCTFGNLIINRFFLGVCSTLDRKFVGSAQRLPVFENTVVTSGAARAYNIHSCIRRAADGRPSEAVAYLE